MSKFTCLVLCAVTVSLSSIYAERSNCMKEYGVMMEDMKAVVMTGDVSKIDPCYWGCYFRTMGLLNDKGQYDLENYLNSMRKIVKNNTDIAALEHLGQRCVSVKDKPVNDGEAGCEMGALLADCFFTRIHLAQMRTTKSP